MKILVYSALDEELCQMIRNAAGENTVAFADSKDELMQEATDAEVLYGFCSEDALPSFNNLKWVQATSAGVERQLYPDFKNSDITLTNAAGLYASQAAEQAFALLLGLTRGINLFSRNQAERKWRGKRLIEINGWTLGIVGMGGFGMQMAQRGKGFNMNVIAVDAYRTDKPDFVDELMPIEKLDNLISRADVVMIACPLTQETHHLINAENLALMKPTAYLINVARGKIIDEQALIEALKQGQIAGAGLDVCEVEPLPEDSPLWDIDNVIITPHVAGQSQNRPRLTIEFFCDNLKRYFAGEPLKNVVNKE
ncbi:MAG: D-2-hydroxyacid dehydrogenase, partial [Candidatus Poribacteria bacterium]